MTTQRTQKESISKMIEVRKNWKKTTLWYNKLKIEEVPYKINLEVIDKVRQESGKAQVKRER